MTDPAEEVVKERNSNYANAWRVTGDIIANAEGVRGGLNMLLSHNYEMYFPWVMILNKLLRILGSPKNPDHWLDIMGYAKLVYGTLVEEGDTNVASK